MKPTNGKASTIMIRKLSKADNQLLKQLRVEFDTDFNTVAVMRGISGYLDQKKIVTDQVGQIEKLNLDVQQLMESIGQLKAVVRDYFDFQANAILKEKELSERLKNIISPVNGSPKLKNRSGTKKNLSNLTH